MRVGRRMPIRPPPPPSMVGPQACQDLFDDHIAALGPGLRLALTATVTRTRSRAGRLLLARAALGDAMTLDDLRAAARAGDRRRLRKVRRKVAAPLLASVAQTLAQQELDPADRADGLAL